MLDTKQSWDDLIRTHAPDEATREQILANPLYQNISGRFVQSHDYIAMERLYEIHTEGKYDLIVVDTPPTRNALDFLDAPQRMADFFSLAPAALADRALPVAAGELGLAALLPSGRPDPRHAVPGRHLGVLHPLPVDVRRLRRAGRGGDPAALGPPHHVHGRVHPRGHAGAGGRVLLGRADGAQAAPRGDRAQQGAARLPARPQGGQAGPVDGRRGPTSWPRG